FFLKGGTKLYGLYVFEEFERESAASGLARLLRLIEEDRLRPLVDLEAPWTEVGAVARQLLDRRFPGKAVLRGADVPAGWTRIGSSLRAASCPARGRSTRRRPGWVSPASGRGRWPGPHRWRGAR